MSKFSPCARVSLAWELRICFFSLFFLGRREEVGGLRGRFKTFGFSGGLVGCLGLLGFQGLGLRALCLGELKGGEVADLLETP